MNQPSVGLVVVAAGSGTRFGGLKQLAPLAGKPVLERTIAALNTIAVARERVLVVSADLEQDSGFASLREGVEADWKLVPGGRTRAQSVRRGLLALSESIDIVAVHDGARPFPPREVTVLACERLAADPDLSGVIISSRVVDTIKKLSADGKTIEGTLDRSHLARAETPQVCRRVDLLNALSLDLVTTDEAGALEAAGLRVEVLLHDGWNPKITVPADLALAEAWLAAREKNE